MTREEAIKWITLDLESWEHQCLSYHPTKEALKMAIEALKEPEIVRCRDCEYCDTYLRNYYRCTKMGNYEYVDSDFFCAAGRRRDK